MMNRRNLIKLAGMTTALASSTSALSSVKTTENVTITEPYKLGALPILSEHNQLHLNYNENALGMSPSAKRAIINTLDIGNRYPDDQRAAIISQIAKSKGVSIDQVSLGFGSSENIQATIQMLVTKAIKEDKRFQLVVPDPTFNYGELYAKSMNAPVVKVPLLAKDFDFDFAGLKKAATNFKGITLFYLCNPNNPTAQLTSSLALKEWISQAPANHYFLLDEAYAEYVTDPSFESGIKWVKQGLSDNIVVTRTFSKLYALAGMRIGYAIANKKMIQAIEDFMSLDNTNLSAAVAASATLSDQTFQMKSLNSTNTSRKIIEKALNELDLPYIPSHANFIFHKISGDVKTYQERMLKHHILVGREFLPIKGYNRLSLGTPEEMTVFVKMLKSFRQKGWV